MTGILKVPLLGSCVDLETYRLTYGTRTQDTSAAHQRQKTGADCEYRKQGVKSF